MKQIDAATFKILKRSLPGPYTFVLPGNNNLPKAFKKRKTIGIRVPDHSIPKKIVEMLGNPIVSTSIYDPDVVLEYTTDPELIFEKWAPHVAFVIDGGYGDNEASTVVDCVSGEAGITRFGKGILIE